MPEANGWYSIALSTSIHLPCTQASSPAQASWPARRPVGVDEPRAALGGRLRERGVEPALQPVGPDHVLAGHRHGAVGAGAVLRHQPQVADHRDGRVRGAGADPVEHAEHVGLGLRDLRGHRVDAVLGELVAAGGPVGILRRHLGAARDQRPEQAAVVAADAQGDQVGVGAQRVELRGRGAEDALLGAGHVLGPRRGAGDVGQLEAEPVGQHPRVVVGRAGTRGQRGRRDQRTRGERVAERDVGVERLGRHLRRLGGRGSGEDRREGADEAERQGGAETGASWRGGA